MKDQTGATVMSVIEVDDLDTEYLNAAIWQLRIRLAIIKAKRDGSDIDMVAIEELQYRYHELESALWKLINK